jgi:hypothetical protein
MKNIDKYYKMAWNSIEWHEQCLFQDKSSHLEQQYTISYELFRK